MKLREVKQLSSFMSRVDTSGECWVWIGGTNSSGYGTFQDGSPKGVGAHVYSHRELNGETSEVVRHTCRNKLCVKPTHLRSGTQVDNMRDKFFDGTGNTQKLSVDDVLEIRRRFVRYSQRKSNAPELAKEFGIGPKYLVRIAEGKALTYVC